MGDVKELREKMHTEIDIHEIGSTEVLVASQELDTEIVKEQLKIWRDYKCKN